MSTSLMSDAISSKPGGLPRAILVLIASGFLAIAATIWLDEFLDLPARLFGAPPSPFSPHEAIMESGLVLMLGTILIGITIRLSRRVAYLETLIVICAWCHRARLDTSWVSIETFLRVHRAESSHGICPDCTARLEDKEAGAGDRARV